MKIKRASGKHAAMMGNHFFDELDEVRESIQEAEVLSLFFPYFGKAILLDTRSNGTDGPTIFLTEMVRNPQERIRSLKRLRPGFPDVDKMILIPWIRYISTLVESGIWDSIVTRLEQSTFLDTEASTNSLLLELKEMERIELISAIRGPKYETIWSLRKDR